MAAGLRSFPRNSLGTVCFLAFPSFRRPLPPSLQSASSTLSLCMLNTDPRGLSTGGQEAELFWFLFFLFFFWWIQGD